MVGVLNIFIGDESFKVLDSWLHFEVIPGLMHPSVCVVSWMGLNKVFEAVMYPSWFFPWMHLEPLLIHHTSDGLNLVISPLRPLDVSNCMRYGSHMAAIFQNGDPAAPERPIWKPCYCDGSRSIVNGSGINAYTTRESLGFSIYLKDAYPRETHSVPEEIKNDIVVLLMDGFNNPVSLQPSRYLSCHGRWHLPNVCIRLKLEINSADTSSFTTWNFVDNNDEGHIQVSILLWTLALTE
ncbi:hypothetical protein DY000_02025779 [Brassica cretica]|uniref:Uncharacterized protein n=1 Tax=Brassica cretica TaxID=69181 RepID=A0ABQ7EDX3_BRACR|nr:hypothetical protein DY000_02025779 [Brassica cretica]